MATNIESPVPNSTTLYKYGFKSLYESLTKAQKTEIKKALTLQDIPYNTFYGYMNIKLEDKADIPFQSLVSMCKVFQVSIFEISNFKITLV